MPKITRFEDLECWQEARILVKMVYNIIKSNKELLKDFRLVNQLQAAAVSSMANISEGFSRKGKKEFSHFLFISKSSAAELQSHLYIALDQKYISEDQFNTLYDQLDKVQRQISNLIKYLNSQLHQTI